MAQASQPRYPLRVEKDVDIQTRDGMRLKGDVYRPRGSGKFPAIINLGSYQKDKHSVPPLDLEEKDNPYMNWETVNPLWWVPRRTPITARTIIPAPTRSTPAVTRHLMCCCRSFRQNRGRIDAK